MKTAAMSPEDVIRYSENVTIRLVTAIIYSGILLSLSFKKKKNSKRNKYSFMICEKFELQQQKLYYGHAVVNCMSD